MNRRHALGLMAIGGATALATTRFAVLRRAEGNPATKVPRFELPLKIPAVLKPTKRTETQDEYDIVQSEAEQEILPGHATKIRGYQGVFPGPTIRVRRGPNCSHPAHQSFVGSHRRPFARRPHSFRFRRLRNGHGDARRNAYLQVPQPAARLHTLVSRPCDGSNRGKCLQGIGGLLHYRG